MDFGYDARTLELRERLLAFMDEHIYPAEAVFAEQAAAAARGGRPWERVPVTEDLKAEARRRGLWNLFLTGKAADAVANSMPIAARPARAQPAFRPAADQPAVRAAGRDHRMEPRAGA